MNMKVETGISGAAVPCPFQTGNVVRIKAAGAIGRVLIAEPAMIQVLVFGEPDGGWGEENETASFVPASLELLSPTGLDLEHISHTTTKLLGGFELISTLAEQPENNEHIGLVAEMFADVADRLMEELSGLD